LQPPTTSVCHEEAGNEDDHLLAIKKFCAAEDEVISALFRSLFQQLAFSFVNVLSELQLSPDVTGVGDE